MFKMTLLQNIVGEKCDMSSSNIYRDKYICFFIHVGSSENNPAQKGKKEEDVTKESNEYLFFVFLSFFLVCVCVCNSGDS